MAAPHSLKATVVIDNGTGYTKMGYAGNLEPSYVVPSAVACSQDSGKTDYLHDLDFFLGDNPASQTKRQFYMESPMEHGKIVDWSLMERVWQRCLYKYLRCDPEEHAVMLTEPPTNPLENREYTAEIMFETFNVPYLYIAVQATLSLACASCMNSNGVLPDLSTITGVAVDSGDGVTHTIPVVNGFVIGSAIRSIPLAGKDITKYVQRMLKERNEPVPPELSMEVAKQIKEKYCYVAKDGLLPEFQSYDESSSKFKQYKGVHPRTNEPFTVSVGYERFIGPELFFNPEIFDSTQTKGLATLVDEAVLASPIDGRRGLYGNIVLSGGSTLFKGLATRLKTDISKRVNDRLEANHAKYRGLSTQITVNPVTVKVEKLEGLFQHYAVWLGGSLLAGQPAFLSQCISKAQYDEEGPRCARSTSNTAH